ncbi:MAG: bile acid:sodium symporter, partial [Bacteroidota bacterium]
MDLSISTLLNIMLFSIMLGMGATLTTDSFQEPLKSPKPFLIGMLSQFGLLPLLGFLIAILFQLSAAMGLGLLMIACTPGGSTSNLYSYYAKGDVALSISMTVASSLAATFMMPLLLKIYSEALGIGSEIQIPFSKIMISLLLLLIPVSLGMLIRKYNASWAKTVEKVGATIGIIAIILIFILPLINNQQMFAVSWEVFIAAGLIAAAGMFFGYILSRWSKLSICHSKTVSLETGIQNAVLTVGIIGISFEGDLEKD